MIWAVCLSVTLLLGLAINVALRNMPRSHGLFEDLHSEQRRRAKEKQK